ncbi:heme lyase CcmF/NrfE family subunit [Motiliproteus coralliicola]|uniref:Heme lyase CcmF/NrfE family subunit n=1 Tax=Motiliproteus coralliicola TaxID=2283196 RepID=A0A369W9P8_9GAMM|nr:heme lyase CcmF/NrfE family subunit [Motiliproteus coralliicola]RDE18033.1 heme lyase CcmF/NrfE family subunit [Motiliproteus coralliicola]
MIPEFGTFSLILALCLSIALAVVPLVGASSGNAQLMGYARPLTAGVFALLTFSFGCLFYAFWTDDFSVQYVANHSNTALPLEFKLSAVWGGHEGSLLLWLWILACWTFAVSIFSKEMPQEILARVLAVMGIIIIGFGLFVLLTSSPFTRYLPNFPADGADLNPLLQDPGLIFHPPMLYMGYVGFSVAFAFAIAALLSGKLDAAWARWSRPWTNVAWVFLTLGIALGSWWAYYELGWGGWWFWDPVENASFMPWLIGTALVHSLAVTEKRGVFKNWTLLLAIFAFSLSLLGTFLVRSGVLTSVHAFATDPTRGMFVLVLLAITVGGSLLLYALKAPSVKSDSNFTLVSRESFLLVNNIILTVVCITVLLGTLYPLIVDALGMGKLSVGPPYFNAFFVPFMSLLTLFIGVGTLSRWKRNGGQMWRTLGVIALLCVLAGIATPFVYAGAMDWWGALGGGLMAWVLFISFRDVMNKVANKTDKLAAVFKLSRAFWGMVLAHIGVGITIVGITMVTIYNDERDLRMAIGDTMTLGDYSLTFTDVRKIEGPNFISDQGVFEVTLDGRPYTTLAPEKRFYTTTRQIMTEAAIDPGLFRDLYVALGEELEDGAWAVRFQFKPFVRWIWLGAIFMSIGGLLAAMDKRYSRKRMGAAKASS